MNRFQITTLVALVVAVAAILLADGTARIWLPIAVAAVYVALVGLGVAFIKMDFFCEALRKAQTRDLRVALTFDDGPDPATTPRVLDALQRHGIRATFFCVGARVLDNPDVAKRIVSEGHETGNHTFHHAWWTNFLLERALAMEIGCARDAILDTAGVAPRYFRPPMGLTNPHTRGALREAGLELVGWDVHSLDRREEPDAVIERVASRVRPGSIILLHDGGVDANKAVEIVNGIVARLKQRGYSFLTVSELVGRPAGSEAT
jgi:peptidoglycan/xylan/chitin deacetylase (PgdA/CDA1 family)